MIDCKSCNASDNEFDFDNDASTKCTLSQFEVHDWIHNYNSTKKPGLSDYTDPKSQGMHVYGVGGLITLPPITVTGSKHARPDKDGKITITFTTVDYPDGFLMDPADGFIQGTPTTPENVSMKIYAVDAGGARTVTPIQTLRFDVRYGPNRMPCANGVLLCQQKHTSKLEKRLALLAIVETLSLNRRLPGFLVKIVIRMCR